MALAVTPVPAVAQEYPALPQLPQFEVESPLSTVLTSPMAAELPLPTPYPFTVAPRKAHAGRLVRLLGLSAQPASSAGVDNLPLPSTIEQSEQVERPGNGGHPTLAGSAKVAARAAMPGPTSLPSSQTHALTLPSGKAIVSRPAMVAASTAVPTKINAVIPATATEDPVRGTREAKFSHPLGNAVVAAAGVQEQSLSLIDIEIELPLEQSTAPGAMPAKLMPPETRIGSAVIEAPRLPLEDDATATDIAILRAPALVKPNAGEGLKLQTITRAESSRDAGQAGQRSTRPVAAGMSSSPKQDSGTLAITRATPMALNEGASFQLSDRDDMATFNLSDAPVSGEAPRFSLSDEPTELRPALDRPGVSDQPLKPRLPSVAGGSRPGTSFNPTQPASSSSTKPMRVWVEGEPSSTNSLSIAKVSAPRRSVPVEFATRSATPSVSEAVAKLESQPGLSHLPNNRSAAQSLASNVVSARGVAAEAVPPRLIPSETSVPMTGEFKHGPSLTIAVEDAIVRQAQSTIVELSTEHSHICRLIQAGPTTFTVMGLQPGTTRIAVVTAQADGQQEIQIVDVHVEQARVAPAGGIDELARQISTSLTQLFPQYAIEIDVMERSLLVQGEVGSEAEAKRIVGLIRKASLMPVIDRLRSPEQ